MTTRQTHLLVAIVLLLACSGSAQAETLWIGDADGFGFGSTAGLVAALGDSADPLGDGIGPGDFLPDQDLNGYCMYTCPIPPGGTGDCPDDTATTNDDSFDNRSTAEAGASDGSNWTDRTLELPHSAHNKEFVFQFDLPVSGEDDFEVDHTLSLLIGDWDGTGTFEVEINNLATLSLNGLNTQGGDGLASLATTSIDWADLAASPTDAMTGQSILTVKITTDGDPFLAIDFVLLDTDVDGDGDPDLTDCDNTDPQIHTGAAEVCDGKDNDCNNQVDDGLTFVSYYTDGDGDSYGDSFHSTTCDGAPTGTSATDGDCDDTDPTMNPGQPEACDGKDNDCNNLVDDGLTFLPYYTDADGDNYGDSFHSTTCDGAPSGTSAIGGDCNDTDATMNPGESEVCDGKDNDCNNLVDDGLTFVSYYTDGDGDNYGGAFDSTTCDGAPTGTSTTDGDCDDSDTTIYPGAPELCDGIDNNCNQQTDEGLTFVSYYTDGDGDNYGGAFDSTTCDGAPTGTSATDGDCDDTDPTIHPGAPEVCDGIDNDCDPTTSDTSGEDDMDLDGSLSCVDCDDNDPNRTPGAPELCDGIDNDCDPATEAVAGEDDADGDGTFACTDCDDTDPTMNPGQPEVCDGKDNDCNNLVDDGLTFVSYYTDGDGDSYGNSFDSTTCDGAPNGTSATDGDCDDTDPTIHPGAPEVCDGIDNDCDPTTSDTNGEDDVDLDGSLSCVDCDDNDPNRTPGAPELCDGIDNDCDPATEAVAGEDDADGDGTFACTDCDDEDAYNFPGNIEICDGFDNDCNDAADFLGGLNPTEGGDDDDSSDDDDDDSADDDDSGDDDDSADSGAGGLDELDLDGDGVMACAGDCDDDNASVLPGIDELCDGIDSNCTGEIPQDEEDEDDDGQMGCEGDCNDADPDIYLFAPELCDAVDNNCDGSIEDEEFDIDEDGASPCDGDCDDTEPLAGPDGTEDSEDTCTDEVDNNCDGLVDMESEDCAPFADSGDPGDDDDQATAGCDDCSSAFAPSEGRSVLLGLIPLLLTLRRRRRGV